MLLWHSLEKLSLIVFTNEHVYMCVHTLCISLVIQDIENTDTILLSAVPCVIMQYNIMYDVMWVWLGYLSDLKCWLELRQHRPPLMDMIVALKRTKDNLSLVKNKAIKTINH